MGTVPIVIFCGLCISHAQGLGELGPPHFPGLGCRPAWYNPKLYYLYGEEQITSHIKDPHANVPPLRNEKGVSSQSFWYL